MLQGTLISTIDPPRFALDHVRGAEGDMLWLSRFLRYGQDGRPLWNVESAVPLPPARPDETLVMGCEVGGTYDAGLVALVRYEEDQEWLADVLHAWRADESRGTLDEIPTAGIRCLNEGWGV
jgi:hypothetical protein